MSPTIFNPGGGLPLDGGTLSGDLKLDGASILIKDEGGAYEDAISISSDVIQFGDAGHQTSILGSATPYFNDGSDTLPLWTWGAPQLLRNTSITTLSNTTLTSTGLQFDVPALGYVMVAQMWIRWYTHSSNDLDLAMTNPGGSLNGFATWERGNGNETPCDGTRWPVDGGAVRWNLITAYFQGDGVAGKLILQASLTTGTTAGYIYQQSWGYMFNANNFPNNA